MVRSFAWSLVGLLICSSFGWVVRVFVCVSMLVCVLRHRVHVFRFASLASLFDCLCVCFLMFVCWLRLFISLVGLFRWRCVLLFVDLLVCWHDSFGRWICFGPRVVVTCCLFVGLFGCLRGCCGCVCVSFRFFRFGPFRYCSYMYFPFCVLCCCFAPMLVLFVCLFGRMLVRVGSWIGLFVGRLLFCLFGRGLGCLFVCSVACVWFVGLFVCLLFGDYVGWLIVLLFVCIPPHFF